MFFFSLVALFSYLRAALGAVYSTFPDETRGLARVAVIVPVSTTGNVESSNPSDRECINSIERVLSPSTVSAVTELSRPSTR